MLDTPTKPEDETQSGITAPAGFDPMTGQPLTSLQEEEPDRFDPKTGKPLALGRFDPKTGEPIHSGHTSFFPTLAARAYWATYGLWALFNAVMVWVASTFPPSSGNAPYTIGELIGTGIFMFAVGSAVFAVSNFVYRKARHLP